MPIANRYRKEIDGLRAISVITVIINHFNKDILPGGYLGVDIFFVISGFVITSSLYQRPNKNFKDFISGFYERRIKRLVPALSIFVLITSLTICFFNPLPSISLKTGLTSLFGVSNLYLLNETTDYFAQSTEFNVFTHTWSLGVEEQFYLVFPFLIWFSGFGRQTKNGARNLFLIQGTLAIASLIAFIYLYPINQPATYFLMPTRFWEMASGCLMFIGIQKRKTIEKFLEKIPPLLILALIFGVMFLPMSWAIFSTVAVVVLSSILIVCLKKETAAFNFFTNTKVVYIGLISYPLYLWHWGVLSISRWTIGIHWWSVPFQTALIIGLAIISYHWIEKPLRKGSWSGKRWKNIVIGSGMVLTVSGVLVLLSRPFKGLFYLGKTRQFEEPFVGESITRKNCLDHLNFEIASTKCWINVENSSDTKGRIFFMGDSHNEAMSRAAEYISLNLGNSTFIHSRRGTVFPFVSQYWKTNSQGSMSRLARKKNDEIQRYAQEYLIKNIKKDDVIIISLFYPYYFGPEGFGNNEKEFIYKNQRDSTISRKEFFNLWKLQIYNLLNQLKGSGASLILSTPIPIWMNMDISRCGMPQWFSTLNNMKCEQDRSIIENEYKSILEFMYNIEAEEQGIYIFNTLSALCNNDKCFFRNNTGELYSDSRHISNYASGNIIGPKLVDLLNSIQKIKDE